MVNYNNSIIYKLCCKDPEIKEIYVGSTTNFTRRKQNHKSICNNINDKKYNLNVYKFIRNNGGWDNWEMVEVERYKAIDKQDLHKQERYILEQLGGTLNSQIPNRSIKEWKEYNKEYHKEWRDNNKEYFKDYRENNKEKFKEYNKEWKDNNKDKMKEYFKKSKEKVECDICGKILNRGSLNIHNKKIHN